MFRLNKYKGLNDLEVIKNQKLYGLNELKKHKKPNFFIVFINEFNDWLVIILIIAALINLIVVELFNFDSAKLTTFIDIYNSIR